MKYREIRELEAEKCDGCCFAERKNEYTEYSCNQDALNKAMKEQGTENNCGSLPLIWKEIDDVVVSHMYNQEITKLEFRMQMLQDTLRETRNTFKSKEATLLDRIWKLSREIVEERT